MITGIIRDSKGKVVEKINCVSNPRLLPGYSFEAIKDKAEFDAVDVYKEPPTAEQQQEIEIQQELRSLALERLTIKKNMELELL